MCHLRQRAADEILVKRHRDAKRAQLHIVFRRVVKLEGELQRRTAGRGGTAMDRAAHREWARALPLPASHALDGSVPRVRPFVTA